MLSVASVKSASGAAKYFTKDDYVAGEYYTDEKAGDVSLWGGGGAAAAGLTGTVTKEAFSKALHGELPSGGKVDQRAGRRPGYDLTFSAPKSVSVMAYVAGDKRILGPDGAHTKAVQQTMAWIEKNLAETRITKDGKTEAVKTGNLVYALFQHDTSRALDPQAHIHAILANLTKGPDGIWHALHADKIWSNNSVIGTIYHAFLRNEMEKLGYQIGELGKHGTFEIAGVPKVILETFSKRRGDIVAVAEKLGIKSTQGMRDVTARTRDPKLNVEDRDGLNADWIKEAEALGFTGQEIREAAELMAAKLAQRENAGPVGHFIWHNEKHATNPNTPAAQARRDELKDTIIVVDETSMVSNSDMLKMLTIAEALGIEKIALIGDRQQLLPIDAGKAFAMMQAAKIGMARMDENLRQRTDQLRTVAALANIGKASQAMKVLGDKVAEHKDPSAHASELWLALMPEDRADTAIFASGRETRGAINEAVQKGLKEEGTLKGDGLFLTVIQNVNVEREDLRYALGYEKGQRLEIKGYIKELDLKRGTAEVTRTFANGKVEIVKDGQRIRFNPQRIDPMIDKDRMSLATLETIRIYEGDRIRWTDNDKERGIYNAAMATITAIEGGKVTVELASKEQVTLEPSDPMLQRMDLAYALNMHMAQGVTTDKAIVAMLSYERNLSNQRLFNVGVTRVRDDLIMVVDNQQKLTFQLDRNPGDKTAALESIKQLEIDGPDSRTQSADDALSAAVATLDRNDSELILIDPKSLDLTDLPPMGKSDTDYSDPNRIDADMLSLDRKDDGDREKTAELRKDDELGLRPHDMDDLSALPAMPGRDDQIPGLPQKNLSLDM